MQPEDIVRSSYDRVSFAYRSDKIDENSETWQQYASWLSDLLPRLTSTALVLDLGCGCGLPASYLLAQQVNVTGVDISPVQIERARELVPGATFICTDMLEYDSSDAVFDAIVCLYAIIHVPVESQQALIQRLYRWLKPGGYLLISAGQHVWTGTENDWLGVEQGKMYWSHEGHDTYVSWFSETGFEIVWERFVPEGDSGHPLFLLRK